VTSQSSGPAIEAVDLVKGQVAFRRTEHRLRVRGTLGQH